MNDASTQQRFADTRPSGSGPIRFGDIYQSASRTPTSDETVSLMNDMVGLSVRKLCIS